jgi:hypothetical protein
MVLRHRLRTRLETQAVVNGHAGRPDSMQVVLFGATFARLCAKHRGALLEPKEITMRVNRKKHYRGIPRLSDQQSRPLAFRNPRRTIMYVGGGVENLEAAPLATRFEVVGRLDEEQPGRSGGLVDE